MQDVLAENWGQLREPMKKWWSRLTDADLDEINGQYDVLVSLLQLKYGYDLSRAQEEIHQRLGEMSKERAAGGGH
jgi:uncharacterized protein YjbJ (UPF0337 family)